MKHLTATCIGICILALCMAKTGWALENRVPVSYELTSIKDALCIKHHRLQLGVVCSDFNYEEPGLMEEKGTLYGVMARYCFRNEEDGMFQTDIQVDFGEITYDGGYQDGTPLKTNTDDVVVEWRAIGGLDCPVRNSTLVTPFLGLGFRYWNDRIEGQGGYEREISYWYVPLGVQIMTSLWPGLTMGASLEYDLFFAGRVESHLDKLNSNFYRLYNDQLPGKGFGIKGALQFRFVSGAYLGLIIEPFVSYWEAADSEVVLAYYDENGSPMGAWELGNNTFHYGVRAMVEF